MVGHRKIVAQCVTNPVRGVEDARVGLFPGLEVRVIDREREYWPGVLYETQTMGPLAFLAALRQRGVAQPYPRDDTRLDLGWLRGSILGHQE